MLPDRLGAYLRYFVGLLDQPPNRWQGFDQSALDARDTELRPQVLFAGCALAALLAHPEASPAEAAQAQAGLAAAGDRLIQRRIWAAWATITERAGLQPDPIDAGYAAYSGAIATLLGLSAAVGGAPRYQDDPFSLHWSSDARFGYTYPELAETLATQLRASPDGAIACAGATANASSMALVLLGLRLYDCAFGSDRAAANERWLTTLRERIALRGPQLPGRGALAASYHTRRRRAALSSDLLEDAMGLALTAPLAPELIRTLAARHWSAANRLREAGSPLALAFSYLLAVELGDETQAATLLAAVDTRLGPVEDGGGRRYEGTSATPWLTGVIALGEAGGLGRLLKADKVITAESAEHAER